MSFASGAAFEARQLGRNLAAGARTALFLPVAAQSFRASAPQYALLVAFNMACWVLAAALNAEFAGELDSGAFPVYLAAVVLVLVMAMLVAAAYGQSERVLLFATALTASDLIFELAGLALPAIAAAVGRAGLVFYTYLAWSALVSFRAVIVVGGRRRPQMPKALAVVALMSALAFFWLPRADPWREPEADEEPPPALADEKLFHLQGELIERELAALERGRPGAELYFVGFAPDGSVDVFLREMHFVKALFDERFGTAGHSIALANGDEALAELPVASVTNLRRVLQRVARVMDADEDVLVLFLSAHGDREHRLSAVQPPLELDSLTPTALSRLLQDAGIRWKVVVVSACYAGGYIEPLRDANTVVITAAAADRTSFGCEAGRDFTYFGEAYFKEGLGRTRSLLGAFDIAKQAVAKKEAAEKLTPSLPQIWVGPAIAAQLKKLAD